MSVERGICRTEIVVMRHGHVAHHADDNVQLTEQGRCAVLEAGVRLAGTIEDGTTVNIFYSDCVRTRETAEELTRGFASGLTAEKKTKVNIRSPRPEPGIRNFVFYIDGKEIPPLDGMHPSLPAQTEHHPYLRKYWSAQDRIGYWLNHPHIAAETPAAVVERLTNYFTSLLDSRFPELFIMVTHSGIMRAFLRQSLGDDPGEPEFCETFCVNVNGVYYRGRRGKILRD